MPKKLSLPTLIMGFVMIFSGASGEIDNALLQIVNESARMAPPNTIPVGAIVFSIGLLLIIASIADIFGLFKGASDFISGK